MLIVAVLGVGAYALYQASAQRPPTVQRVEVPNVVTYTEQQARDQLAARNLKVEIERENGDEETKGTITAQDPVAGTQVVVDSTVTLTLNEGPKTAVIPDNLIGKDVDDVEQIWPSSTSATSTRLRPSPRTPTPSPTRCSGSRPGRDATVALDAKITVTYATGKSEVPNFDGLPRQRAIETADEVGFRRARHSPRRPATPPPAR